MTKFFKQASIAVFVFIGLPIIIGLTLIVRKAIKNAPPPTISKADSIKIKRDSIQAATWAAAEEEKKHPKNWYYRADEDPMTSDTVYYATVSPKENISVRTNREIMKVSVTETGGDNRSGRAYDDGYRNGYNNAKRNTNSFWGNRSSSYTSTPKKRTTTTSSTNYASAYLTFTLVKKPGKETDAYIDMADGAFNPSYFNGGQGLHIRFDKDKDAYYPTLGDKAQSGRVLYLASTKGFLAKLKKAKTMLIEVDVANTGRFVLEFDVHDLDWKRS
ncbi:hypothetical protein SAMN05428949_7134 [Chitinophaga sp. YR627]|uniref:hypothetical protein n=1 Tax=Chitinophaga sp. YR627 TaxID=1881041 RepID=UPI0008EEE113|nr:hypothetical protein [Chitinophaga sp. YR627]SFP00294.1 hypothetical protein SAMN05428949_7134 [Chitinophaga sp. YR627]